MNEFNIELTPQILVLVPMVAGIIQILKKVPAMEKVKEWLPIIALVIGIGLCYASNIANPIMPGITIGLMSSGAYSALKGKAKSD